MIPKGSFIEVNDGFKFHYYDDGDGHVVLLLHGSGTGASGHTNFKNNFIALRDAGFRVILPDLPGYGFSKVSKMQKKQWSEEIPKYFNSRENLKYVFLITDCRTAFKKVDLEMIDILESLNLHYQMKKMFSRNIVLLSIVYYLM